MKKCYILLLSCFLGMTTKTNCMSSARQGFGSLFRRVMSTMVDQRPLQPRMSWNEAVNKNVTVGTSNVMELMTWLSGSSYYPVASRHGLMNADIQVEDKTFANIVHYLVSFSTKNEEVLDALRVAAKYGADLNLKNNYGKTPLQIFNCSTSTLDQEFVKIFHDNGVKVGKNLPYNTASFLKEFKTIERIKKNEEAKVEKEKALELERAQKARDLYNNRLLRKYIETINNGEF